MTEPTKTTEQTEKTPDTKTTRKPRRARSKPVDRSLVGISSKAAWNLWVEVGPDLKAQRPFADHLTAIGHKISSNTIGRWMREQQWHSRPQVKLEENPYNFLHNIKGLIDIGRTTDVDVLHGLFGATVAHLAQSVPQITITTPKDAADMVECLDGLNHVIHGYRGIKIFGETKAAPDETPGKAPVVDDLGAFRREKAKKKPT